MTDWKENGKYPASKFAIDFREDHPDLFPHLAENGYLKAGKTYSDAQWIYTVKEITSKKDGKKYTLVERMPVLGDKSPEQMAHDSVKQDYAQRDKERQERIDKAHQENLEVERAKVAVLERIAKSLEKIAQCVNDDGELFVRTAKLGE